MQWKAARQVVLIAIGCAWFAPLTFSQKLSFGVITGAQLIDDFRSLTCPDLNVSQLAPPPGCRLIRGVAFGVANASRGFIIGPKVNLRFTPSFSLEVDALHRQIRSHNTATFQVCPLDQLPDCTTPIPRTQSSTETQFTWEFPVLARYQMSGRKVNPFIEGGPSFRPAENREETGYTAGAGAEMRLKSLRLTPGLRYTHWRDNGRYLGENHDQFQFVVGIDGPESTESVGAFGHNISLGIVTGVALTGGLKTHTETFVNRLDIDPVTGVLVSVDETETQNSNRKSPIVGVATEVQLPKEISVGFSALYRPLNGQHISVYSNGVTRKTRFTVLTWEFPLLVKYKFRVSATRPFLELGPSFRASGNLNGANPSRYGLTAGTGIELPHRGLVFAPTLRFTHWAPDNLSGTMTRRNHAELVFGVRF